MKKTVSLMIILGLLVGAYALPAEARKRKPKKVTRTAESAYDSPALGHPDAVVGCSGSTGCATFAVGPKEKFVTFKINDASGTPTYGSAGQDLDGDQFADTSFSFCGETPEPVAIEPGFEINIFISAAGGTGPPCAGIGTNGTVTGTFSNLP